MFIFQLTKLGKTRMEKGLSFQFNYTLMQSYDFLNYIENITVNFNSGNDQWSNILVDELIRRIGYDDAFGMTLLSTTSEGKNG